MPDVATFPDDYTREWLHALIPPDTEPLEPLTLGIIDLSPPVRMRFVGDDGSADDALIVSVLQLPGGRIATLCICAGGHLMALPAAEPDGTLTLWEPTRSIPPARTGPGHEDHFHDVGAWVARVRNSVRLRPASSTPERIRWDDKPVVDRPFRTNRRTNDRVPYGGTGRTQGTHCTHERPH